MSQVTGSGTGAASQAVRARTRTPTILIADDSIEGREMMSTLLGMKGYDVLSAENGVEALEIALKQDPDLVLIDLELPEFDGIDFVRNLRRRRPLKQIPIIIVSGHDPAKHRQTALDAGCTDYLCKPIDFDHLDEILNKEVPLI